MLILASASPRREHLLREAGLHFEIQPVDLDEDLSVYADGATAARGLARAKARARAALWGRENRGHEAWVIGADTVVALQGEDGVERLLAKPADELEAGEMLASLSGSRHSVITGVAVVHCPDGQEQVASERTWVTMRAIEEHERRAYVASGEWRGKAGGYAIQETADAFVTALDGGGFDNVVGLPVALTQSLLREAGWGTLAR